MREHSNELSRRAFIGGTAALGAASLVIPTTAFAAPTAAEKQAEADAVRNQLVGLQADLEEAAENYYKAVEEREAAQEAMEAEQAKIDETNEKIADVQGKLGTRARSMYRSGSSTFLDFILGATTFQEFTQNWDLLNQMNESDTKMVDESKRLREDLQMAKEEYAKQEQIAAEKAAEAKDIQEAAQDQVNQAQAQLETLDAEARELLEAEQAAAAAAAAAQRAAEEAAQQQQQQQQQGNGSYGGSSVAPAPPSYGGGGAVGDWSAVVSYAYSCIGTPYVWGGATPGVGMDCSGLVSWCYAQVGLSLPHYTESLFACAKNRVPVSQARPGDVLYRPGHVGIAAGYGGVPYVHAPTFGAYVRDTDSLSWSGFTYALQF